MTYPLHHIHLKTYKLIIVLSYNGDAGTTPVLDWLKSFGSEYRRINLEDEDFRNIQVQFQDGEKEISFTTNDGFSFKFSDVSYFFFRGGMFQFKKYFEYDSAANIIPSEIASYFMSEEFNTLTNFFYEGVAEKCLGNPLQSIPNKLSQLDICNQIGLHTPKTVVTSTKKDLQSHFKQNDQIITKSIQENVFQAYKGIFYEIKVKRIHLDDIEDTFYPSLFQEGISKEMELRTFYLNGKFYTISMTVSADSPEVIDFRENVHNLSHAKYQLPKVIENKLKIFMKEMNLKTGSIDLLLGKDGNFYFLEVNPTGQYDWVSVSGNYYIEREIAQYLNNKDEAFKNKERTSQLQVCENY